MNILSKNESFSGATAKVKLDGDKAILSTEFGMPNEKAKLRNKIDMLVKLRHLTTGVSGLVVPRVIDRNDQKAEYVVERATGVNLTEQQGMTQGVTREFFKIPIEQKVDALITYFRMVGKVNDGGFVFRDHKTDSVFLQPDGTITIVDSDGMTEEKDAWQSDQHDRNGIKDIVFGFFSRGMDKHTLGEEGEYLTPGGVIAICTNLNLASSARIVADRVEGWLHNTYDPSKDYPYNTDPKYMKPNLLRAGMTNAQYDIADAQQYLQGALESNRLKDYLRFKEQH